MKPAHRPLLAGQGDVHRFPAVAGRKLQLVHLLAQRLVLRLDLDLEVVDDLAHGRPVFLGDRAQALHQISHRALLAQEILPERGQLILAVDLTDLLFHFLPQGFDPLFHVFHSRSQKINHHSSERCHFATAHHNYRIMNYEL